MRRSSTKLARRFWPFAPREGALPETRPDERADIAEETVAAREAAATGGRRFLIVTPAFNAGPFIDEAIASVLRQGLPGYSIHYHVQDGGSTDGTLDKLRAWERRLNDGFPVAHADSITFSFASERDGGMYDALQRGFARLAPRDDDVLTWINSDDALAQGSLVTVAGVFGDVPDCEFLSGRIALLNEGGAVIVLAAAIPYARGALADGLHDGRTLPFLMQEGTFFSGRVWNAVGGVDRSFRLAGDWDLWRRMARVASHYIVDSVTGYHRRRRGQLSSDMDTYYREIDAASTLPPGAGLGPFGTVVTFDQASAQWIETAYDPSAVTTPALLRDGRPERSVACRPVAGFRAPEGPYPQFALPSGIRWIEGRRADIAMYAPAAGRYRLRLTIRAARDGVVVGLGIGTLELQPIALEPPVPLVDQVIETVRWLEAGENRLVIDCDGGDGPADTRSVLLIGCEVTSTDETFARRPILPPSPVGHADRRALAIAILCDDDEPDLLDLSLAGCEQAALAGTSIFVARDPGSAALARVTRFRHAIITGCIDVADLRADSGAKLAGAAMEPLRRMLHAAGHAEVLVIRRGSVVKPGGIDAASALLDATGATAASGLIDERDSMGRALRLSLPTNAVPALYRANAANAATLRVGCALTQAVAKADEITGAPVVWVLDGDRPMLGRTPAALLAAGLALLGYDIRHVVVEPDAVVPAALPGTLIVASRGLAGLSDATMTIGREGGNLRLVRQGGDVVDLPPAVDTDLLLPRDRGEARRRLDFLPDEQIVCIAEATAADTATAIARVVAMTDGSARILNFGHAPPASPQGCDVLPLDGVADPLLLSYLLCAANAALVLQPGSPLTGAAWACCLTVLDQDGTILRPAGQRGAGAGTARPADAAQDVHRSRDLMIATCSLAALADAIDERCPGLGAIGGSSPLRLRGGTVRVRSYRDADRAGWFDRPRSAVSMTALGNAVPYLALDGERGLSIGGDGADIIACLDGANISKLRLHVRGTPGDTWTVHVGDGTATLRIDEDGTETVSVTDAYEAGPIRIRFERQGSEDVAADPLHLVGLTAVGEPVSTTLDWEETRFELVPAADWPLAVLETDGDWQRVADFLPPQLPVPQEGLHAPFHWSLGRRCAIRVRTVVGGPRMLCLALSAGVRHQRVRPVVAGRAYDWCAPLAGPIGHIEHREWLVDWPVGDIDVMLEISEVLRAPGHDLGIMVFAATLASLPVASYPRHVMAGEVPIDAQRYLTLIGERTTLNGRPGFRQRGEQLGVLVYGPYLTLGPGDYEFAVSIDPASTLAPSGVLRLDVASDVGCSILFEKRIIINDAAGPLLATGSFTLAEAAGDVEIRAVVEQGTGWTVSLPTLRRI